MWLGQFDTYRCDLHRLDYYCAVVSYEEKREFRQQRHIQSYYCSARLNLSFNTDVRKRWNETNTTESAVTVLDDFGLHTRAPPLAYGVQMEKRKDNFRDSPKPSSPVFKIFR